MQKKIILIVLGVLVVAAVAIYSGSAELFQGRIFKSSNPLPAYNENSCYDSDGGKNYEEAGTIYGKLSRSEFWNKTDVCTTRTKVKEYYCNGQYVKSKQYDCENGCSDGACKKKVESCQYHPGGKLELGWSGNYAFDDGSEYFIELIALQKESFKGDSIYMARFEVNGVKTPSVRIHDHFDLFGDGLHMMITDIKNEKVYFELYKDCVVHSNIAVNREIPLGYSELNCEEYVGPGTYTVKACDRIKQTSDSKVFAYVQDVDEDIGILISYFIITDEGYFQTDIPNVSLNGNVSRFEGFGNGFFGLNLYTNNLNFDSTDKSSVVEVLSDCDTIFDQCMDSFSNIDACAYLCPFEETEGYYLANVDNEYFSKIPLGFEASAECQALRLKSAIPKENQFIGYDYPFPMASIVYLNDNPYISNNAHAAGFGYITSLWGVEDLNKQCSDSPNDFAESFDTADHEMNHNYFTNSSLGDTYGLYPSIEEGLVNYVANIGLPEGEKTPPLDCQEKGYMLGEDLKLYDSSDTFSGQCFWQKLEAEYGYEVFVDIMQQLDESRYIDPKAGRKKSILLFKDIINPVIGSDVLEKRAQKWFGFHEDY